MQGRIIKGIGGFYYIHTLFDEVYECKAKGIFRNKKIKPLVGDRVEISVIDQQEKKGNIVEILPRKNQLIRPAVSNIDQVLVIFATTKPSPNLNLLDRFLITMEEYGVEAVICFHKKDIAEEEEIQRLSSIYQECGYRVLFTSTREQDGILPIREILKEKTTVLAGPSGVGKSSIINLINPDANMETGDISRKIERGKHTTRHSELFFLGEDTFIMDTPGFSTLYVNHIEASELKKYFKEFHSYEQQCRFQGCIHINEPDCGVKAALEQGNINKNRYENYITIYEELKLQKKY